MMFPRRYVCMILFLLLAASSGRADSSNSHVSSGVAKERRRYIQTSIDELNGRAKSLRKAITHRRAACAIVSRLPSESADTDCGGMKLMAAADRAISTALVLLKSARLEMQNNNFDLSEKYLRAALKSLSEARKLVSGSDD